VLQQQRLQRLIDRLHARAQPPLPAGLIALIIEGTRVGDVQPQVARFLGEKVDGFSLSDQNLTLDYGTLDFAVRSKLLAHAAKQLRDAGMISGWRDEVLSVGNPPLAVIERAACRPLGITTQAVHLNAYVAADTLLVSRRAIHKQIDPGLWDNLVGGMVPADETLEQALAREAWEEAGLRLDRVRLERGRSFHVRRSVPEGLQSEIIHAFDSSLPPDLQLRNRDGEVDAIDARKIEDVVAAIERDEFTLESALATLESVARRDAITTPPGLFSVG
jgi:8-oxo-dGTP pyrophosphatase MutT (NUDIX family)